MTTIVNAPTSIDTARSLVTDDGVTLLYRLWRPARPRRLIVLIHGLASNLTRWTDFVSTTALRDSWDLLRLDLRGFGGSVVHDRTDVAMWCRDIAAILEAERASRAVLIGHCLGANVALHFAARYPPMTDGLVLIEPMFPEALTGALRASRHLRPLGHAAISLVRATNRLGAYRRKLPALDLAELDRRARGAMAARGPSGFPENEYGSPLEDLRFTPTAVYLSGLLAITEPLPDLRDIDVPVLALLSSGGRYGDPAIAKAMLARLPLCETRTLTARHWIPTEQPREMRAAIETWCSERWRA
jgi:pimeloyl-ACP methyl ester carboxylesterase